MKPSRGVPVIVASLSVCSKLEAFPPGRQAIACKCACDRVALFHHEHEHLLRLSFDTALARIYPEVARYFALPPPPEEVLDLRPSVDQLTAKTRLIFDGRRLNSLVAPVVTVHDTLHCLYQQIAAQPPMEGDGLMVSFPSLIIYRSISFFLFDFSIPGS